MTPPLKIGQVLKGAKDTYLVLKQLHQNIWGATTTNYAAGVAVKTAPKSRLFREQDILRRFQGHPCIRQLIDQVEDPSCLVLERLQCDALEASGAARLARSDIKFIARRILEALSSLHEDGIVHTDVKPNNILLDFDKDGMKVVEAKLSDCGDAWNIGHDINPKGEGHIIGAAIFRSPEAMLQLRWATPTDIWSFGATLISLIWGKNWHIFKPDKVSADHEEYAVHVLIQQARFFGPFPLSYEDVIDTEQNQILAGVLYYIEEHNLRKPFSLVQDEEVTSEDKEFICKIMQMDPRDRPTAKQLLADEWFNLA